MELKNNSQLGLLIKKALKQKSMSMRRLGSESGIDTATISRIVNGKQPAKLLHLEKIAECLQIPLQELIEASGFDIDGKSESVQDVLAAFQDMGIELHDMTVRIKQELAKYEEYAQTPEGDEVILSRFPSKLEQLRSAGFFIDQLKHMHRQYTDAAIGPAEKAVIGSALLYFILSTDIIPDYIFPFGYIDDAIAIQIVLERLVNIEDKP